MKKLLAILLSLMMIASITACGNNETTSGNNENSGASQTNNNDNNENSDTSQTSKADDTQVSADPMEEMLNRAGVKYDDIKPPEETFDVVFDEEDDEISFYMEKETERDASAYMNQLYELCKATSDDGKLYEANFDFYMGTNMTEFPPLPSAEEINDGMMYMMQFGYLKDGATVTVTASRVSDMHPTRSDDIYYPVYIVSFGF